jgi:lactate/malate dehydrogenase family protein
MPLFVSTFFSPGIVDCMTDSIHLERIAGMKIGVIGAGAVGSACLLSTVLRGVAREIVVVNRDRKRAKAVVTDLQYGAVLSSIGFTFKTDPLEASSSDFAVMGFETNGKYYDEAKSENGDWASWPPFAPAASRFLQSWAADRPVDSKVESLLNAATK